MFNDTTLAKLYQLVENDDEGREQLLVVLGSKDPHQFFNSFYKFLEHIAQKNIQRAGAGSRKSLRHDIFRALGSFAYIGLKVSMANEAVKNNNFKLLKSFSSASNEEELDRVSRNYGLFGEFSSARSDYLSMHADLQSDFSESYNFRPEILSALEMGSLALLGSKDAPLKIKKAVCPGPTKRKKKELKPRKKKSKVYKKSSKKKPAKKAESKKSEKSRKVKKKKTKSKK